MPLRKIPGNTRKSNALCLTVFVHNQTARNGVPLTSSFEGWIKATLQSRRKGAADVNIIIVDEATGLGFNRDFRKKNYATNVLSFPCEGLSGESTRLLGDIVFCAPVLAREAAEQGKRLRDHYAHMTVHGVLHLLGYDHLNEADAEHMEALERRILADLGIADPY